MQSGDREIGKHNFLQSLRVLSKKLVCHDIVIHNSVVVNEKRGCFCRRFHVNYSRSAYRKVIQNNHLLVESTIITSDARWWLQAGGKSHLVDRNAHQKNHEEGVIM